MAKSAAPKPGAVAEYLAQLIDRSQKTQREIAFKIGYTNPNIITMFKQGLTKVPIEAIPRLANALDEDPAFLLRMALREYMPDVLKTVEGTLGRIITEDEQEILQAIRSVVRKPRATPELLEALKDAAQKTQRG
jgi:transcriptional regulator with XRE-family HTH domain